jgi:hypothetical protein
LHLIFRKAQFTPLLGILILSNVTNIEKKGSGCLAGAGRRHRGEVAEGEEGDATPDLLLKHSDVTLTTYV